MKQQWQYQNSLISKGMWVDIPIFLAICFILTCSESFLRFVEVPTLYKKFSIKDFFSKCDQIHRKLGIWSYLLKKSFIENFTFCVVRPVFSFSIFKDFGCGVCNRPFSRYGCNICLHLSRKGLLDVQGSYFLARLRIFGVFSYVSVKRVVVLVFYTS